ncbi:putative kelch-type beta propeller [Lupinus albus]|uniref:Putative kelch-type beta propeller n=1 Tax=Lupinus albus TaxID=3870 RepID=A0A6A4NAA0_LUPAL|nr:putative kelch-type beta propeller [Lupinus albus]
MFAICHNPKLQPNTSFVGTNGLFFITAPVFCYTPILHPFWHAIPNLHFPRINPLLAVFNERKFVVVGGVKFIGNLVDIEDRLHVEIYDPSLGSWEICPPLPGDFRSGNSPSSLSSALFKGKFYVDERTMVFSEIGAMPHDLLYDLFDGDEYDKF